MSFVRKVVLDTKGSAEKVFSDIFKEHEKRRVESIKVEGNEFILTFTEEMNYSRNTKKTIVKQFSKKKYTSSKEAISFFNHRKENRYYFFAGYCPAWEPIKVIELSNSWLVFFKRIF